MKKIILSTCSAVVFGAVVMLLQSRSSTAVAQLATNTYTANVLGVAKINKKWPVYFCNSNAFPYNGQAIFQASQVLTNHYYIPDTNIITVIYTNSDALMIAESTFGINFCGHSPFTFTDTNYPNQYDRWAFVELWPTNKVVPTNQPVSITVIGVHTNTP